MKDEGVGGDGAASGSVGGTGGGERNPLQHQRHSYHDHVSFPRNDSHDDYIPFVCDFADAIARLIVWIGYGTILSILWRFLNHPFNTFDLLVYTLHELLPASRTVSEQDTHRSYDSRTSMLKRRGKNTRLFSIMRRLHGEPFVETGFGQHTKTSNNFIYSGSKRNCSYRGHFNLTCGLFFFFAVQGCSAIVGIGIHGIIDLNGRMHPHNEATDGQIESPDCLLHVSARWYSGVGSHKNQQSETPSLLGLKEISGRDSPFFARPCYYQQCWLNDLDHITITIVHFVFLVSEVSR